MSKHAAIFIDHKEARVFHFHPESVDETTILAPHRHVHRHAKRAAGEREHPDDAKRFFDEVARSVDGSEELLIVGPSTAKLELVRYLHEHDRALEAKIVGIETVDHPSDGQLVAYAKTYFKAADRMR